LVVAGTPATVPRTVLAVAGLPQAFFEPFWQLRELPQASCKIAAGCSFSRKS
jgi:hypothetical protein